MENINIIGLVIESEDGTVYSVPIDIFAKYCDIITTTSFSFDSLEEQNEFNWEVSKYAV